MKADRQKPSLPHDMMFLAYLELLTMVARLDSHDVFQYLFICFFQICAEISFFRVCAPMIGIERLWFGSIFNQTAQSHETLDFPFPSSTKMCAAH